MQNVTKYTDLWGSAVLWYVHVVVAMATGSPTKATNVDVSGSTSENLVDSIRLFVRATTVTSVSSPRARLRAGTSAAMLSTNDEDLGWSVCERKTQTQHYFQQECKEKNS